MKANSPIFPAVSVCRRVTNKAAVARLGSLASAMALALVCAHVSAQSDAGTEMTLEQLEAYIAEQKAALETVIENRDLTAEKAESVNEALAAAEAREAEVQAELEALCEEREEIEAGSKGDCLVANGS